jgi:hypothetical protein
VASDCTYDALRDDLSAPLGTSLYRFGLSCLKKSREFSVRIEADRQANPTIRDRDRILAALLTLALAALHGGAGSRWISTVGPCIHSHRRSIARQTSTRPP